MKEGPVAHTLNHVKPHGAFFAVLRDSADLAQPVAQAVRDLGDDVMVYWPAPAEGVPFCEELGQLGVRIDVRLVPVLGLLLGLPLGLLRLLLARNRGRGERGELLGRRSAVAAVAAVEPAVPVRGLSLGLGGQRDQRPRENVDLVGREHGAVGEVRLLLGEQALEPEQQRELAAPVGRRVLGLRDGVELGERLIERPASGSPRRERDRGILPWVHEALAHELFRARDVGGSRNGRDREGR